MNLSDVIQGTTRPFSSLQRELSFGSLLFRSRSLAFTMQAQTESNWCWAATSTSVSHFYWSWSGWTQCKVACAELNLTTCCQSPSSAACNVPWTLQTALTTTKNLHTFLGGTVSFETVKAEIDAGRPVGVRIGWSGGGGHFVAIYGYTRIIGRDDYFDIDDPIYGKSHITVSDFTNRYQTTGSWTHTYLTQSYIQMPVIPILVAEAVLEEIREKRPLLGLKAGLPMEEIAQTEGLRLGLAHGVFTLGLHELAHGEARPGQTGVRVMEFGGELPRAYYDVAHAETPGVRQMSASGAYLELLPRAMAAVSAMPLGERKFELRLLQVPALNFEALWLHAGDGAEDKVIPFRGFHGFAPMQAVSYGEAVERLRHAAQAISRQDETSGS